MTPAKLQSKLRQIDRTIAAGYPYLVSSDARKELGRARDATLTFGITPPRLLLKLFERAKAKKSDVFWDIGSGPGTCVLAAAQVVRESHGVELLPQLAQIGIDAAKKLEIDNAHFHVDEFQKMDVSKGTLFYCYSTCFTEKLMSALAEKLATAPDGARVITVTRPLQHEAFEETWTKVIAWGRDKGVRSIHVHVRRPRTRAKRRAAR